MGQNSSSSNTSLTNDVEILSEDVLRTARLFSEVATLGYSDFLEYLKKLNTLSHYCMDADGKQLMFVVKKGSDSSMFWRTTVRIACVKLNPETQQIDSFRLMDLIEFLKVFRALNSQYQTALQISKCEEVVEEEEPRSSRESTTDGVAQEPSTSADLRDKLAPLTTSVVFREVDRVTSKASSSYASGGGGPSEDQFVECCICLDRTPNIMLPCAHSYCKQCIERWNVSNKTCPVCREEVKSSDDAWVVISEAPNSLEVNEELCSTLMNILGDRSRQHDGGSSSSSSNDNIRRTVPPEDHSHLNTTDIEDYEDDDDIYIDSTID